MLDGVAGGSPRSGLKALALIGINPPVPWTEGEGAQKFEDDPMNQRIETRLQNLRSAPRCGAKTRAGTACQCPAMRGRKRCRRHGGLSPGGPRGQQNGNFRDGQWTAEAIEERRWLRTLVREFGKVESSNDAERASADHADS